MSNATIFVRGSASAQLRGRGSSDCGCSGIVAGLTFGAAVVLGLFSSEARVVLEGLINAIPLLSPSVASLWAM